LLSYQQEIVVGGGYFFGAPRHNAPHAVAMRLFIAML